MSVEPATRARSSHLDERDDSQGPSTADVLAEVERRQAVGRAPMDERQRQVVILADRFVFWLTKHWLAVLNALVFLYVGLPFLAPVLMHVGAAGPARVIYTMYRPLCHQLPQRSWFLFGPQLSYRLSELMEQAEASGVTGAFDRAFIGNEPLGYKVALCQRDTAIYGAILLFGLTYGLLRRRFRVVPLPWWAYLGFGILPMLLDGGYQFLSYALAMLWPAGPIAAHETTPALRLITGGLFGLATVWLAYPLVQEAMDDFRHTLQQRFGWQ
jgi:uncharacterized membrane protein